jgi:hypothetical protein
MKKTNQASKSLGCKKLLLESAIVGLVSLSVYLHTQQRSVSLPDSAVVMDAITRPVVSAFVCNHSLNNLIGWLIFRLLPFGDAAWRCNFVSVVYGSLSISLLYALICRLKSSRILAVLVAATVAISHSFWWHSTVVENYMLSALLFLACAHLLVHATNERLPPATLFWLPFVAGLSIFNHLQNGMVVLAALFICRRQLRQWRRVGAGLALGLAPYLVTALWELVTGRYVASAIEWFVGGGFARQMFSRGLPAALALLPRLLCWNYPGPFALIIVVSLFWAFLTLPKRGPLVHFSLIVSCGNALFFMGYDTWDTFSFFLLVWIAAAVVAVAALVKIEHRLSSCKRAAMLYPPLFIGVLGALPFYNWQINRLKNGSESWLTRGYSQIHANYRHRFDLVGMLLHPARRDNGTIHRFIETTMEKLPANAVLIDDGSTYDQFLWLIDSRGTREDITLKLLSHPELPGRGSSARQLALEMQWVASDRNWFIVSDRGHAATILPVVQMYGYRLVPYRMDDTMTIFAIVK